VGPAEDRSDRRRRLRAAVSHQAAHKDAELISRAGAFAGVTLDVAAAVEDRFARAAAQGHAEGDMVATYHASFDARPAGY
jgi:3-hydroxyisobutyrate dehydrogenase